ncbi:MAG TPA: phosphatase PAP2 family protein [Capsulimonadaceae bacterium]|nr:phosphatase PAP2 family protein [Capsulimonadaceae bacterium]
MPETDESRSHAQRTEATLANDNKDDPRPVAKAVQTADTVLGGTHNPWIVFAGFFVSGLVVTICLLALMAGFHHEVIEPQTRGVDVAIMSGLHADASPALTHVMFTFTDIGSAGPVFALIALFLTGLLLGHHRRDAIGLAASVAGALVLNQILKQWFQRQRPDVPWALAHERSFSFPSGHAMMGMVVFGMLAYLLFRYLKGRVACALDILVAIVLVVGIGTSRVYLGVHYPTDILGGWIAGGMWLFASILAMEALHRLYPPALPK